MSIQQIRDYISNLLNPSFYTTGGFLSSKNSCLDMEAIYSLITSSHFRKSAISAETEIDIKNKLEHFISTKRPIVFSVPFGAYKSWKHDLGFTTDWAEVFNLAYLTQYASSILKAYPYGIKFCYSFSDHLMYFVSDIPKEKAQNYHRDFQILIDKFNGIFPDVIKFELVRINDLYNSEEDYYIDFLSKFLDNLVFWDEKYPLQTQNRHLGSAERNLYPYGIRDINNQSDAVKQKYIYYSALMTDAVDCLSERRRFNKESERIQLVGVKGPSKSINIGACGTSTVHFWVGKGCFMKNKGIYKPYIFTSSQISKYNRENRISTLSIDSCFSNISDNYEEIQLIN